MEQSTKAKRQTKLKKKKTKIRYVPREVFSNPKQNRIRTCSNQRYRKPSKTKKMDLLVKADSSQEAKPTYGGYCLKQNEVYYC